MAGSGHPGFSHCGWQGTLHTLETRVPQARDLGWQVLLLDHATQDYAVQEAKGRVRPRPGSYGPWLARATTALVKVGSLTEVVSSWAWRAAGG